MMYKRYVEDLNQVAIVPPPGAMYDVNSKKVIVDENPTDTSVHDDERTARILTDIANSIMPGITMEFDVPSRNADKKMPILDMEVWMEEGKILFQHYEKPTASQSIMHAKSAQSVHAGTVCIHRRYLGGY